MTRKYLDHVTQEARGSGPEPSDIAHLLLSVCQADYPDMAGDCQGRRPPRGSARRSAGGEPRRPSSETRRRPTGRLAQSCHGHVVGTLPRGRKVGRSGKRQARGVAMQHLRPGSAYSPTRRPAFLQWTGLRGQGESRSRGRPGTVDARAAAVLLAASRSRFARCRRALAAHRPAPSFVREGRGHQRRPCGRDRDLKCRRRSRDRESQEAPSPCSSTATAQARAATSFHGSGFVTADRRARLIRRYPRQRRSAPEMANTCALTSAKASVLGLRRLRPDR